MRESFTAETLKLRKRPATWVLGIIWLAAIVFLVYFLTYTAVSSPPPAPPESAEPPPGMSEEEFQQQQEQNAEAQRQFQEQQLELLLPENLVTTLSTSFSNLGGPIALILGALAVGSEYGWGTFKTILSQRPSRFSTFIGKLLALLATLLLFVILAFAVGAACSLIIAGLEGAAVELPPVGELLGGLGAGALIFVVYAALGVFLAALLRSTALAIGIGLVYALVVENIIFSLQIENETLETAREFFLVQNANFLARSFIENSSGLFGLPEPPVEPGHAVLVLSIYAAAFVLISVLAFQRRDVA